MTDQLRLYHDPLVLRHGTGEFHPEGPRRVAAVVRALENGGFPMRRPPSPERTRASISLVHDPGYVERFRDTASLGPDEADLPFTLFDSPDNPMSRSTFDVAERTVGLVIAAVDDVMTGTARRGFVVTRPPGHHARAAAAMGFCFFNAVAVAARDAQRRYGAGRVLVADFDVHHGNGTQETFWEDGSVAYLSVHRYPFYPGTGGPGETGSGPGLGLTVNAPLEAGAGDETYAGRFESALDGLLRRFRPELVLVSAGFDAHRRDPLGGMGLSGEGYGRMTRALAAAADTFASGRLVSVLEGGYDPVGTAEGALAHARVLAESAEPQH
ncbi:MAG: histone deacetylase [Holophagales bacterium]|nr:histone deacetylase [Holophagales bacterium]